MLKVVKIIKNYQLVKERAWIKMMSYELFKDMVLERIPALLPPMYADCRVSVTTVRKVNQQKEALNVMPAQKEGEFTAAPNIYLDDLYDAFMECQDMDAILEEITECIVRFTGKAPAGVIDLDLGSRKNEIVMNLINTEKNKGLLKTAPHKEFLDLSIVYRLIVNQGNHGLSTILITNPLFASMEMTVEQLDALARENTEWMFPAKLVKLNGSLYMMTNSVKIHGAATMLYKNEVRRLANKLRQNLYIIPSSIHEIMIVPAKSGDIKHLIQMLEECNRLYVAERDVLSNTVYLYHRKRDEITMAASYFS